MNGGRPSYQEIADELRDRIHAGRLPPGSRLPTQAKLAEEFGVERGAVRQALRVLAGEGLLVNVTKGSPPQVAHRGPALAEPPRPTMVSLGPQMAEAFAATDVRVDALCLTAETLMLALGDPLRQIYEERVRPRSVKLRVLLPSSEIDLAFPVPADGADGTEGAGEDDPVHSRWLAQRNAQGQVLRHNLLALRGTHGIDVDVAFRALPFTPPVKLYLLNGAEALLAYYMVTKRQEPMGGGMLDMYDVLGTQSLLFSFGSQRAQGSQGAQGSVATEGHRDTAFVQESQKWFDALWNTIAVDLTLT